MEGPILIIFKHIACVESVKYCFVVVRYWKVKILKTAIAIQTKPIIAVGNFRLPLQSQLVISPRFG